MKFSITSLFFLLFLLSILFTFILNWYQSINQWGISENLGLTRTLLLRDGLINDKLLVVVNHSPMHSISIGRQISIVRDDRETTVAKFDFGFSSFDTIRKYGELKGGVVFSLGSDEIRDVPIPDHLAQAFDGFDSHSYYKKVWAYCATEGRSQHVFCFDNFQPHIPVDITVDEAKERIHDDIQRIRLFKESNN